MYMDIATLYKGLVGVANPHFQAIDDCVVCSHRMLDRNQRPGTASFSQAAHPLSWAFALKPMGPYLSFDPGRASHSVQTTCIVVTEWFDLFFGFEGLDRKAHV